MVTDSASRGYNDDDIKAEKRIRYTAPVDLKISNTMIEIINSNHLDAEYDVDYCYSKLKSLHEELAQEAFKDSERKARLVAEQMGKKTLTLGKVKFNPDIDEDWDPFDDFKEKEGAETYHRMPDMSRNSITNRLDIPETMESEEITALWIAE